ncbi:MAG: FAD:protein FMN transferase, partial [Nakamurella sp.]
YSLDRRPGAVAVPGWDDVLTVDGNLLTTTEPVLLDVGAAGKGYLVDLLAEILQAAGIGDYLIDGSGDLAQHGQDVCRVGLEHPLDPTMVVGVANLQNAALCASATNRRRWGENLHHIIDPATAEPTVGVLASWVVADTAILADGLATALFLSEPATLADHFDFSYVRMLATGAVEYSTNFPGELFR